MDKYNWGLLFAIAWCGGFAIYETSMVMASINVWLHLPAAYFQIFGLTLLSSLARKEYREDNP